MKKRFFNALILGAVLLSTGAVTSCKDYDDDINNLQSQIDNLSQLETLKTDVATLNTAVAAAKTAADDALKAAQAAQSTADKKADAATVTALENAVKEAKAAADKANADLATAKTELQALIDSKASAEDLKKANEKIAAAEQAIEAAKKAATDADAALKKEMTQAIADATKDLVTKAALDTEVKALDAKINTLVGDKVAEQMKALQKQLEELQGIADKLKIAYSSMITDIQLFHNSGVDEYFGNTLSFMIAEEVDNDWSWKMPTEAKGASGKTVAVNGNAWAAFKGAEDWTFKEGNTYVGEDSLLVRVSPANAILAKENVSLINSQGKDISNIVEVTSVAKYDRLLTAPTRAAGSETGLWVVKFKPVTNNNVFDVDAFEEAAIVKKNSNKYSVLYAVAVKNSDKNVSDNRCVTSDYALNLKTQDPQDAYDFTVNDKSVNKIRNRYYYTENGQSTYDVAAELIWTGKKKASVIVDGSEKNAEDRYNDRDNRDDRWICPVLAVERGSEIVIDFTNYGPVKGFYVTLDDKFALESGNSEINAWTSYKYTGVGYTTFRGEEVKPTIFEGSRGVITVEDLGSIVGDIIGFRVYAVNYDGTLVDPDGRAFYVSVGEVIQDVEMKNAANASVNFDGGSWIFESDKITEIGGVSVDEIFNGGDFNNFTDWENETADASDNRPIFVVKYYDAEDNVISLYDVINGNKKVAYLKFVFNNPGEYVDEATYTQTMTLKNKTNNNSTTFDVRNITVSFKKTMPEIVPTYAKTVGQSEKQWITPMLNRGESDYKVVDDGAGNIFYKNGRLNFRNFVQLEDELFSYWNGSQELSDNKGYYRFNVADATYDNDGVKVVDASVVETPAGHPYLLNVYNKPADNLANLILGYGQGDVKHAVTAEYWYKSISKYKNENGQWLNNQDYKVTKPSANQKDVNIIYCSWTKMLTIKTGAADNWVKNKKNVVKWVETYQDFEQLDLKQVEIKIDGNITPSKLPASENLGELIEQGYLKVIPSTVAGVNYGAYTKAGAQINPYFTVMFLNDYTLKLSQLNQSTMTPGEHSENVIFKVVDCFGCEFDITLPITVKPSAN